MKKTLIFTATYNEVENIKNLVDQVFKNSPDDPSDVGYAKPDAVNAPAVFT